MAIQGEKFKWDKPFGPYKAVIQRLFDGLNQIQPIEGLGIALDQTDHGRQISSTATSGGRAGGGSISLPFQVKDVSADDGLKVQVTDGKINGEFPAGMGFGNYILDVAEESFQEVYAIVTFDSETLDISSRTLGVSNSPPDSEDGTAIIPIADLQVTYDGDGNPILAIEQIEVGDINFDFLYGQVNGQPSLFLLKSYGQIAIPPDDE